MTKDKTAWKRMAFKNNKVWLATDRNGKPVVKNGKVLIKYQLDQDYEYWVHKNGVKPINQSQIKKKGSNKRSSKKDEAKSESVPEPYDETSCHDAVCIYTDGASSGNPGPAGIGVLLRFRNHEKEISRYIGIATNNIAELEAIRTGLLELKKTDLPVRIFTDSSYVYGLLVLGWKARKNQDIVKSIREIILKFNDLKIIKVKGHAGHAGNERADLLATSAIKKAETN
jgi:ribonuclease HI